MILVDTNVWSEATKPNANRSLVRWVEANRDELWLSTIVIAEIRAGIENPAAASKRTGLETWLRLLEAASRKRILMFDRDAAYALGALLLAKPQHNKMLDTLLAAQALSRDCAIATRNTRDFEWTGARLVNPWQA